MDSLLEDAGVSHGYFDGVLIDAGCSAMQFDNPERGFALSQDGPLDMRMDGERLVFGGTLTLLHENRYVLQEEKTDVLH